MIFYTDSIMKKYILSAIIAFVAALFTAAPSYALDQRPETVTSTQITSLLNDLSRKVSTCTTLAEQIKSGDNTVINEALLQLKQTNTISKQIKKIKGYLSAAQYSQYLTELSKLAQVKSGIIAASKWIKE